MFRSSHSWGGPVALVHALPFPSSLSAHVGHFTRHSSSAHSAGAVVITPVYGFTHLQRQSFTEFGSVLRSSHSWGGPVALVHTLPFPSSLSAHVGHFSTHSSSLHSAAPFCPGVTVVAGGRHLHSNCWSRGAPGSHVCPAAWHVAPFLSQSPTGSLQIAGNPVVGAPVCGGMHSHAHVPVLSLSVSTHVCPYDLHTTSVVHSSNVQSATPMSRLTLLFGGGHTHFQNPAIPFSSSTQVCPAAVHTCPYSSHSSTRHFAAAPTCVPEYGATHVQFQSPSDCADRSGS